MATPDSGIAKLKVVELVRVLMDGGRIAAELAEALPDIQVELNALSVELYNGAIEMKDAWAGRAPQAEAEKEPEPFREVQLSETEAWALVDKDDLSAEQPFPIAVFDSEDDAKGFALLKKFIDAPVVRLCRVRGSLLVDVAPNQEGAPQ